MTYCQDKGTKTMSSTSTKGAFELSAKRRALLDALLSEQGINTPGAERISRREEPGPAPLSFAQRRLWFFDQFEPGNPAYNLVSSVLLQGKLNTDALEDLSTKSLDATRLCGRRSTSETASPFR